MTKSRQISLCEANAIIMEHANLKRELRQRTSTVPSRTPSLITYIEREQNAFIFQKEDILRFFDDHGNKAEYLVIFLGAHPTSIGCSNATSNTAVFPPGSQTVVIAGCVLDGNDFKALANENLPANEYSPNKVQTQLEQKTKINEDNIESIVEEILTIKIIG